MQEARQLARAMRDHTMRAHDALSPKVRKSVVRQTNPLIVELVDAPITLTDDQLALGSWLRFFDERYGLTVGDTVFLVPLTDGSWLAIDAVSDADFDDAARVFHSATQSIPNNATAYLLFDSETYDTSGVHDSTNKTRLVCKTPGLYAISGLVVFAAVNTTGVREARLRVNRSYDIDVADDIHPSASASSVVKLSTQAMLQAGDYVEVYVYQNSGGSLNSNPSSVTGYESPSFMMAKIG